MIGLRSSSAILLLASCVFGSPTDIHTVKKRVGNLPVIPGDDDARSLGLLKQKKWRLEPVEVKQVEAYKQKKEVNDPEPIKRYFAPEKTVSKFESSESQYSNVNGNVHLHTDQRGQANENGRLVGSFHRSGSGAAAPGKKPHTQELSEIDLPDLNVHEKMMEKDGQMFDLTQEDPVNMEKRMELDEELVLQVAAVLAGYIEQTGDEAGVAEYIQQMILKGEMKESEALVYLNTIKELLYNDEQIERERESAAAEAERESEAEVMLNFSDYLDRKYESGEMTRSVYRELKDKLMETVLEKAEEDPKFLANPDALDR